MFWGVTLETGKRYSQVVDSSYHLSMAALEPLSSAGDNQSGKFVSVMIEHNKSEFLLCTLEHSKILQVKLDHCFVEGEEVTYFLTGEGTVHLTGYILTDGVEGGDDSDDSEENGISMASLKKLRHSNEQDDDDSEDDEDWKPDLKKQKSWATVVNNVSQKNAVQKTKMEKAKMEKNTEKTSQSLSKKLQKTVPSGKAVPDRQSSEDEDDDDEEDDEDFMMGDEVEDEEDEEEEGESAEDSDDNSADESLDEEESQTRPVKKTKLEDLGKGKMSPGMSISGKISSHLSTPSRVSISQEKGSSKKKNKKQPESSPQAKTPNQRNSNDVSRSSSESTPQHKPKKSIGGVEIQDIIQGNGPVAKNGKMAHVYYRGTLPNKKEFDSCVRGKAFSFRVGRSEVIKGWDVGIEGMKVGGKRKLTIPPSMGYGNRATGSIPPNSILHFEVELKAVS